MKRTRKLALTSLMAVGGVSLSACGDNAADNVRIEHPAEATDGFAYQSLQQCKDKQASCEDVYGPGQCVPRQAANGGGSIWGPLIAGFVVGRMMDGGWGGRGLYRDGRDGGFYTAGGGRVWTDYSSGRTRIDRSGFDSPDVVRGPQRMQTRSSVISRGGFGGRMSSYSAGGGHWGG
jgi:uncharacterized protein YgiB involved in biofilm formation